MQLSKPAKIALILGILLILAVVLVLWINKKNSQNTADLNVEPTSSVGDAYAPSTTASSSDESVTPGESATNSSSDQINYISVTPTASASATSTKVAARTPNPTTSIDANGVKTYTVNVTPAPNAGPYDWTVTNKTITIKDISNSPLANKSLCQISGLSDDWSNIFSKTSCDLMNFFDQQIVTPLAEIICGLTATNIQQDTGRTITNQFQDGACLIIDRSQ